VIIKCAWCGIVTGNKSPYGGKYDKEITHGICESCLQKNFILEGDNGKTKRAVQETASGYQREQAKQGAEEVDKDGGTS